MNAAIPPAKQGEVWDVGLDPIVGHEQGGTRPALVVSVDQISSGPGELCIVTPFTKTDRGTPLHVRVEPPEGGLRDLSFAMPENIRAISRARLVRRRGTVRDQTLEEALKRIHLITRAPR